MGLKQLNQKMLFAAWNCHNKKWHTYQLWDGVLRRAFKRVATYDPKEIMDNYGKEEMNKRFLEVVKKEQPDYIFFWFMYEEFHIETLAKIREISPKTVTLCYNGDDDYKFWNYNIHFFPFIDYFLATQPEYLDEYKKMDKPAFFSCGADIKEFRPLKSIKNIDVSFVGTPKNDRVEYMRHLLNNGIKIRVYGSGWEHYPEFKGHHGGEIDMHNFVNVINESKINICLSKNYLGGTHILERFFEINACKSFCLTEYAEGYKKIFREGKDIVTFKDKDELLTKVKYYIKNEKERQKVADLAYKKTLKGYSNEYLFEKALKFIENDKKNKYGKGIPKINKKIAYIEFNDLNNGRDSINESLKEYDFVSFKDNRYNNLEYKEYMQMNALISTGKDICVCDSYVHSNLIGDYASVGLSYAINLKDKKYFYSNLGIPQIMVKKEFLLNNIGKFIQFYKGNKKGIVNEENTVFIFYPLVRTGIKTKLPIRILEHVMFWHFEEDLLAIKNQGKLLKEVYLIKLFLYSLFNSQVRQYILRYTLKRTKNDKMIKISRFFDKIYS